jgi:hypothetical protein
VELDVGKNALQHIPPSPHVFRISLPVIIPLTPTYFSPSLMYVMGLTSQ